MVQSVINHKFEYKENYWGIDIYNVIELNKLIEFFEEYYKQLNIFK